MIPIDIDIDNFIVTKITNACYNIKYIYIKNINFLPKEISNCIKLTSCCIINSQIINISVFSNCKLLTLLELYNNKIKDASVLSKCISLTYVGLTQNNIEIKPIFKKNIHIIY